MAFAFDLSILQLAAFGFFTGLGTTFGARLADLLFEKIKKKTTNVKVNAKGDAR